MYFPFLEKHPKLLSVCAERRLVLTYLLSSRLRPLKKAPTVTRQKLKYDKVSFLIPTAGFNSFSVIEQGSTGVEGLWETLWHADK